MGFRIVCPRCGSRPYTEFSYAGELLAAEAPKTGELQDFERVWLRRNAAGRQEERWFHALGCRRWLTVERDTVTNEIHAVR